MEEKHMTCPRPLYSCLCLLSLILLLLSSVTIAGERSPVDPAEASPAEPKLLARFNGKPVTEDQVLRRLQSIHGNLDASRQDPARWQRMQEAGLEAEIRDRLLLEAAMADGLEVTPEDLDASLQRSKQMLGEVRYQAMLQQRGATEQEYRDFLRQRLLIEKYQAKLFADITVDDATLREYYRGHKELFELPDRVLLQTLIVKQPETAKAIHQGLKDGRDFAEMAQQHAAPSAGNGGVMTGWMAIRDLTPAMRAAVESAQAGDVLEPIEEAGGIRLIKVQEIQPARTLSFTEAKERMRTSFLNRRRQKALDDWYETAIKKAEIEYLPGQ
jgi:parvulin-like peptidyl-prolyl isomerase